MPQTRASQCWVEGLGKANFFSSFALMSARTSLSSRLGCGFGWVRVRLTSPSGPIMRGWPKAWAKIMSSSSIVWLAFFCPKRALCGA